MEILVDNIICILVMVVLLMSIEMQKDKSDKTSSRFSLLAHIVLGFLITDLICDLLNGKPRYTALAYLVNILDFLWIDGIIIAFSAYLKTLIGHISKKWEKIMNPGVFFTYLRILIILVLAVTGKLFLIDENGVYEELPLAAIPYFMTLAIMLILMAVVIRNKSHFTPQQLIVMLVYLVLPLVGAALELVAGNYVCTVISTTISVLLIYTMVQSRIIEGYRIRESLLEEISTTDLLTHLNNRRAYYHFLSQLKSHQSVGVVFCDINGLKFSNDTLGHAEGDKLLLRFAELLTQVFDTENLFRISGDEFVVVVPDIGQNAFYRKADTLEKLVAESRGLAALGSAYGAGDGVEQLVSIAERAMYQSKRLFYDQNEMQRGTSLAEHPGTPVIPGS